MVLILKNKAFQKWAIGCGLLNETLLEVIHEIEAGLYDANLGGYLFKKRIAIHGRGKSSGLRTIIAFKKEDRAVFLYGFAKSDKSNLTAKEESALKLLAKTYFELTRLELDVVIQCGELVEVTL